MERTPDQVAADNALEAAIVATTRAYEVVGADEIVTSWIVAGAAVGTEEDRTVYFHLSPGPGQSSHVGIGLMRCVENRILAEWADD